MGKARYISSIETYLQQKLKVVSKNVYAGHLPSTLPTDKSDFIVIDCSASIYDYDAYEGGTLAIYLYAMPTARTKNVAKLAELEDKYYTEFLPNCDSEDYVFSEVSHQTDYNSTYGMDFIYSLLHITIKE
jgi:hypothetical protein